MSHFTVLVPASDEQELYQKLLPYYEYGCSSKRDEDVAPYLKWNSKNKEARKKWNTETVTRIRIPETGELVSPRDDRFELQQAINLLDPESTQKAGYPKEWEVEVPVKELYPNFRDYLTEYCGYHRKPGTSNSYGYWHNPNAEWDWYSVGGRWTGTLRLKVEYIGLGESGEPGLDTPANDNPLFADVAQVGQVDWKYIRDDYLEKDMRQWNDYQEARKQASEAQIDEIPQGVINRANEIFGDTGKRGEYWRGRFPTLEAMTRNMYTDYLMREKGYFLDGDDTEKLELSEAEYRAAKEDRAITWAFIDLEGKWNEKADMGWWGMHGEEKPDYDKAFWKFIYSLPPEQNIYVVDCHI